MRFCKILGFADDTKLFHTICCIEDAMDLQLDLNAVYNWSVRNKLPLNIGKCAVLSFYRGRGFFDTRYNLNNEDLKRVTTMKDLGVIFSSDLKFGDHLTYVINKAKRKLGFVIRSTFDFKGPNTIIALFKSLVLPILTYAAQIWSPTTQQDHNEIEKIVHRALRNAAQKSGNPMSWIDHDYTSLYEQFKVLKVKQLHLRNDLCFMFKVLKGSVCPQLRSLFPSRSLTYSIRRPRILKEFNYDSVAYGFLSPVARLRRDWNKLSTSYNTDISLPRFKELAFDYVMGL